MVMLTFAFSDIFSVTTALFGGRHRGSSRDQIEPEEIVEDSGSRTGLSYEKNYSPNYFALINEMDISKDDPSSLLNYLHDNPSVKNVTQIEPSAIAQDDSYLHSVLTKACSDHADLPAELCHVVSAHVTSHLAAHKKAREDHSWHMKILGLACTIIALVAIIGLAMVFVEKFTACGRNFIYRINNRTSSSVRLARDAESIVKDISAVKKQLNKNKITADEANAEISKLLQGSEFNTITEIVPSAPRSVCATNTTTLS